MCTGTKSEQEARTASRKYAKILQKLGYAVSFKVGCRWMAGPGTVHALIVECHARSAAAPAPRAACCCCCRCCMNQMRLAPCIPLLTPQEFKIQNMVGSCDVKFPIRLEGLASTHAMFCSVRSRLRFAAHSTRLGAQLL